MINYIAIPLSSPFCAKYIVWIGLKNRLSLIIFYILIGEICNEMICVMNIMHMLDSDNHTSTLWHSLGTKLFQSYFYKKTATITKPQVKIDYVKLKYFI